jgi:predicted N-acyltransferase
LKTPAGRAYLVGLREARGLEAWSRFWQGARHDQRHYELVDQTIPSFEYHYLLLEDYSGSVRGIQPVFVCAQSILDGLQGRFAERIRRLAPKLGVLRILMAGSPVGEGGLGADAGDRRWCAWALGLALPLAARRLRASMVVLKEFPADQRSVLDELPALGYTRVASMPDVTLDLDFKNFDEHLQRSLSSATRKDLRRKFRDARRLAPVTLEVTNDISDRVDELYPLYLQVYERATLRFERLTPEYLRGLGRTMPDRARFFIWTQRGKPVAFNACTLHENSIWADYLGMDYGVALDLHLYFIVMRDVIDWGCQAGLRRYCGTSLGYEPKLRLGLHLLPMDLYLRHRNPIANGILSRVAPWLSPVRHDEVLQKFPDAKEL